MYALLSNKTMKRLAFFFTLCPLTNHKKQNCSDPLPPNPTYNSYQILSKYDSDCPSRLTRVSWRIKKLRPKAKYTKHTLIIIFKKINICFPLGSLHVSIIVILSNILSCTFWVCYPSWQDLLRLIWTQGIQLDHLTL